MKIDQLSCRNFRNIEKCNVTFDPHINVIVGLNGQGKTNLLESIAYLSTTRSFRIKNDQELIQFDTLFAKIECQLDDDGINKKIGCVIYDRGKTCFLGNQQIPKVSDFIGICNAILFMPSDMELFSGSPKNRRKMMDIEIGKIDHGYNLHLSKYNKLLKERNATFKQAKVDEGILDVLEQQMVEMQLKIHQRRKNFIDFINERLSKFYKQISKEENLIECIYDSFEFDDHDIKENLIYKLKASRTKDMILKTTSFGIHRDDINFLMNQMNLDSVASQGQRRMVILCLKLAFIEFASKMTGKNPILLLDDVLSELDIEKRKNLFQMLPKTIQTIITTTDLNDILEDLPRKPTIFVMKHGNLEKGEDVYDKNKRS